MDRILQEVLEGACGKGVRRRSTATWAVLGRFFIEVVGCWKICVAFIRKYKKVQMWVVFCIEMFGRCL